MTYRKGWWGSEGCNGERIAVNLMGLALLASNRSAEAAQADFAAAGRKVAGHRFELWQRRQCAALAARSPTMTPRPTPRPQH
jgi:hypothetical protein